MSWVDEWSQLTQQLIREGHTVSEIINWLNENQITGEKVMAAAMEHFYPPPEVQLTLEIPDA